MLYIYTIAANRGIFKGISYQLITRLLNFREEKKPTQNLAAVQTVYVHAYTHTEQITRIVNTRYVIVDNKKKYIETKIDLWTDNEKQIFNKI